MNRDNTKYMDKDIRMALLSPVCKKLGSEQYLKDLKITYIDNT